MAKITVNNRGGFTARVFIASGRGTEFVQRNLLAGQSWEVEVDSVDRIEEQPGVFVEKLLTWRIDVDVGGSSGTQPSTTGRGDACWTLSGTICDIKFREC